jgi:hypothetical protein
MSRIARCGNCRHFCAAALRLEQQLPGLRTLGSAFGSVRAGDGLCGLHERYLSPSACCRRHQSAAPSRAGAAARPTAT